MSPLNAFLVIAALIIVTSIVGALIQRRAATARTASRTSADDLVSPAERGATATLVQFSTEFCAQCPGVRRSLASITADRDDLAHVEIDLTNDAALAQRLNILQTPTVFVLDGAGTVISRFSGATPRAAIDAEVTRISEAAHV